MLEPWCGRTQEIDCRWSKQEKENDSDSVKEKIEGHQNLPKTTNIIKRLKRQKRIAIMSSPSKKKKKKMSDKNNMDSGRHEC